MNNFLPKLRWPRSETLIMFATMLAAIAAAFSAFAAFRQERATFTSVLYGKQVEELGKFLTVAQETAGIISKHAFLVSNGAAAAALPRVKEAADQTWEAIGPMRQAAETFKLVSPPKFAAHIDFVTQSTVNLALAWGLEASPDSQSRTQADKFLSADAVQVLTASISHLARIRQCAYQQLSGGEVLTDELADRCLGSPPEVKSSGLPNAEQMGYFAPKP